MFGFWIVDGENVFVLLFRSSRSLIFLLAFPLMAFVGSILDKTLH
jgi:hypothetical protein